MATQAQLEWAVREYSVVTEHLMDTLAEIGDENIPRSIIGALALLAGAINAEWGDEVNR